MHIDFLHDNRVPRFKFQSYSSRLCDENILQLRRYEFCTFPYDQGCIHDLFLFVSQHCTTLWSKDRIENEHGMWRSIKCLHSQLPANVEKCSVLLTSLPFESPLACFGCSWKLSPWRVRSKSFWKESQNIKLTCLKFSTSSSILPIIKTSAFS